MGALPALRVSRLHSGPIAADPFIFLAQRRGQGATSQIVGPYKILRHLETVVFEYGLPTKNARLESRAHTC